MKALVGKATELVRKKGLRKKDEERETHPVKKEFL